MFFRSIYFVLLFLLPLNLFGQGQAAPSAAIKDPKEIINVQLNSLDHLIKMTALTLHKMEEFRQNIAEYQTVQNQYLENTQDRKLLFRMTKLAYTLQDEIKKAEMTHAFDTEFMSELNLLARIYKKKSKP